MDSFPTSQAAPRPSLRLFSEDLGPDGDEAFLSPSMRLSEFFERWFVPIVLGDKGAHDGTVTLYRNAIAWWVELTGDPPLNQIDEFTISQFKAALRKATYVRGKRGRPRPLEPPTINKHLRHVRAVLHRTGPTTRDDKPCKELLARAPYVSISEEEDDPLKPPFTVEAATAIVAATAKMPEARQRAKWYAIVGVSPAVWWRAFVLVMFYCGHRVGTVLKLRFSMVTEDEHGAYWLTVPKSIVRKTKKSRKKFLHPAAAAAIERMRVGRAADDLIFPWPHNHRHAITSHQRLQRLAGIEPAKVLEFQAWRRTHSEEINKLGAAEGRKAAQRALDHADEATTSRHYTHIEALLIAELPSIDVEPPPREEQRRLF